MANGFIWYELMTTDAGAAASFYAEVVGWTAADAGGPNAGYTIFSADGRGVAGAIALPDEACAAGARPGWIGYVAVPDVDAAVAGVEQAGGSVHKPGFDIAEVGRAAIVADPTGATFALLAPRPMGDPPAPLPRMSLGNCGWHELQAGDGEAAFRFYSGQYGWTEVSTMEMGPMGTYRIWAAGGESVGGMMTRHKQMERPAWLFYFVVGSVDAAAARIVEAGGTVVNGPMEVPDGSWIVQGIDPQGATFALVSERR